MSTPEERAFTRQEQEKTANEEKEATLYSCFPARRPSFILPSYVGRETGIELRLSLEDLNILSAALKKAATRPRPAGEIDSTETELSNYIGDVMQVNIEGNLRPTWETIVTARFTPAEYRYIVKALKMRTGGNVRFLDDLAADLKDRLAQMELAVVVAELSE